MSHPNPPQAPNTNFHLLPAPRAPTHAEDLQIKAWFPYINADYKVLDLATFDYNCLGWAVGEAQFLSNPELYVSDTTPIHDYLLKKGFVEVPAEQSMLDVWRSNETNNVTHFSKYYFTARDSQGKWTSKCGQGPLITHDREAIRGATYGSIFKHYAPRSVVEAQAHASSSHVVHLAAGSSTHPGLTMSSEQDNSQDEGPLPPHSLTIRLAATHPTTRTAPSAVTHPTTAHPIAAHPATAPPTTSHPSTTAPKTPGAHAGTTPSPTSQAVPAAFQADYAAWKHECETTYAFSSDDGGLLNGPAFKKLVALGQSIKQGLLQELQKDVNGLAIVPYNYIMKRKYAAVGSSRQEERLAILKENQGKPQKPAAHVKLSVSAFAAKQDHILSSGLSNKETALSILTDPLFLQIVREGGPAVAYIIQEHNKSTPQGKLMWEEMLKQIHAIEQHGANKEEEKKDFEQWLSTFAKILNPSVPAAPAAVDTSATPASALAPAPVPDPSTAIDTQAQTSTDPVDTSAQE